MKRDPVTENDVKALTKERFDWLKAWHWAPVSNGMGVHGIPDRVGAVPVVVTPAMVGKKIALFVAVECKKPGRRGQQDRGMSKHQKLIVDAINEVGGIAICADGIGDLNDLTLRIGDLVGMWENKAA
jgi:hypothetical protein